jgi:hypothetical protein
MISFSEINYKTFNDAPDGAPRCTNFKDINLTNNIESNKKIISDKVFIAFLDDRPHHLITDTLLQYEYLKKFIPEIKILFFKNYYYKHSKFSEFIFNEYSGFEELFDLDKDDLLIKDAYFIFQEGSYKSIFSYEILDFYSVNSEEMSIIHRVRANGNPYGELNLRVVQKNGLPGLTNKFKDDFDIESSKKIYVSRSLANKRHKDGNAEPESKYRYYDKEHLIEKYFMEKGYTSVCLENLSPQDQIHLMKSSSHVAGCQGTGMLMTIFCKSGTKIIELDVSQLGTTYLYYNQDLNHDVYRINLKGIASDKDILSSLNMHYESFKI